MIVPMKKATLIVQVKDAQAALVKLRSLGIMHVEHQKQPKGEDIASLKEELSLVNRAIEILSAPEFLKQKQIQQKQIPEDWRFIAKHLIDLHKRLIHLEEYAFTLRAQVAQWQPWGDFDPMRIEALLRKGIHIGLYEAPLKEIKNIPSGIIIKEIYTSSGIVYCLLIAQKEILVPFKEVPLPKMSLNQMRQRLYEDGRIMELIQDDICKYLAHLNGFKIMKKQLAKRIEFSEVLGGMGQVENLVYLRGFIPFDKEVLLEKTAARENWGFLIEEPTAEDAIPTLIRNPRWISIISPVFRMIEVVPGYREFDISLWMLIFLSIFFGMLIGDAAYGTIFFIATVLAQRKWKEKIGDKSVFYLFYLFSSCAIIWGVLTGTFFGQEWLSRSVQPLLPALREDKNLQALCFFLGALHLSIAHLWRAMVKAPSPTALSDIGWAMVLWGGFFLARTLILADAFPGFAKWLFIAGPLLVIFFTSIRKNFFKGLGAGLGNLLLNFVNSFTDVVSYIRLFAVGLATVAVADAFNKMAMEIGFSSILTGAATALILLLGHTLNLLLGPMAVLVHGVRLNVLEFCNHIDVKWSGFSYRPLQERIAG